VPKRRLHISDFRSQVRPADDPGDLRLEEAEYAEDISLTDMPGALKGRRGDVEFQYVDGNGNDTSFDNAWYAGVSEDEKYLFVYRRRASSKEYRIVDLDSLTSETTNSGFGTFGGDVLIPDYRAFRVGSQGDNPEWVGQIDYEQFDTGVPSGTWNRRLGVLEGPLIGGDGAVDPAGHSTGTDVAEDNQLAAFVDDQWIFYAASYIYDEFQEGPLKWLSDFYITSSSGAVTSVSTDWEIDVGLINDRVTHICFYALLLPVYSSSPLEEGSFELVEKVPIAKNSISGDEWSDTASWSGTGAQRTYTLTDKHDWGSTYPKRTGVTQALDHMTVKYTKAAKTNAFTFYTGADVNGVKSDKTYVFRSKSGRPDMIDWSKDRIKFDFRPVALTSFKNRLAVFGDSQGVLVDPRKLTIIEAFDYGCVGQRALVSGDRRLFWASDENIHVYNGNTVRHIGDLVSESPVSGRGWSNLDKSNVQCIFLRDRSIFVALTYDNVWTIGWAASFSERRFEEEVPQIRWTAVTFQVSRCIDTFSFGERTFLTLDDTGEIWEFGADKNNRERWRWVSKEIGGGQPGPERVFYNLETVGDDVYVQYREDRGAWQNTSLAATTPEGRNRYEVNSSPNPPWQGVTRFQFELDGLGEEVVRSATLTFRERAQTS